MTYLKTGHPKQISLYPRIPWDPFRSSHLTPCWFMAPGCPALVLLPPVGAVGSGSSSLVQVGPLYAGLCLQGLVCCFSTQGFVPGNILTDSSGPMSSHSLAIELVTISVESTRLPKLLWNISRSTQGVLEEALVASGFARCGSPGSSIETAVQRGRVARG